MVPRACCIAVSTSVLTKSYIISLAGVCVVECWVSVSVSSIVLWRPLPPCRHPACVALQGRAPERQLLFEVAGERLQHLHVVGHVVLAAGQRRLQRGALRQDAGGREGGWGSKGMRGR